jgi:hypothetical protein
MSQQDSVQAPEHEPIRPEATRAHAQGLGPQAGQQILQMTGAHASAMHHHLRVCTSTAVLLPQRFEGYLLRHQS